MAGPRSSADFYVTFGSNAESFSKQVPNELAGARAAVAELRKDIQALYDDTRGASPSLAQGLIAELQEANKVASKLKTELAGVGASLTQELDRVLGSLRNMKPIEIKVKGVGAGGQSAAGAVRDEVVAQAQVAEAIPPAKTTQRRKAAASKQTKSEAAAAQANEDLAVVTEAAAKKTAAAAKKTATAAKKTAETAGKAASANESIAASANSQVASLELIAKQGQLTSEALQRAATKAKVPLEAILSGGLSPSELNKVADSLGIGKVTLKRNAVGFTDAVANLQARVNDRIASMKKQLEEGGRALEQLQELPPTPVATAPSAAAPRPGGKRQQAIAFASGKSADQLLADLEKEKGNAGALAQALGIGGRGTPQEVARRIAKVYGDMAQQAGETAVKQAQQVAAAVERQIEGLRLQAPHAVDGNSIITGRSEAEMRRILSENPEGLNKSLNKIGYRGNLSATSTKTGVTAAINALLDAQQNLPEAAAVAEATKDLGAAVANDAKATKRAAKATKRKAKAAADLAVAEDTAATTLEEAANYERKLSAQMRDQLGERTAALKQSLIPTLVAIQETETPAVQKARKRLADAGLKVDLGARGVEPIRRPAMVGRAGATAQELQRLAELPPDDLARVLDTGPHAGPLKDRPRANYSQEAGGPLVAEPPSLALRERAGGALTLAQARQRAALRDVSDARGALIAAKSAATLPGGMPGDREASEASAARFTAAQTAFEKAKTHLAEMDSQVLSTTKAFVTAQGMLDSEMAAGGHGRTPLIPFGASPGFGDDTSNLFGKSGSIIPTPENIRTRPAGLESISGGIASTVTSGKLTGKEAEDALKEAQANLKALGPDMQTVRDAEVAQRQAALEHASRVLIENPDLDTFGKSPVPKPRKPRPPGENATQDQRAQYQKDSEDYRTANAQYKSGVAGWKRLVEAVRELDAHMAQEANILDALKNDPVMQSARLGQLVNSLGKQGLEATPAQVESMVHFGAARHAYVSQQEAEIESIPAGFTVGGTASTGPGGRRRTETRVKANERALRSAALNELFGARIGQIATGIDPSKTQFAGRDYALAEILPGSTEKGYSAGAFQRGVAERGRTPNDANVQELRNLIFGVQGGKGRGRGQAGLVGSISKGLGRTHDALLRYGQELRDQGLDPKSPDSLSEEQRTALQGKIDAYEKAVARYYDQRTKIFEQVEKTFGTPVEPLSKETLQERKAAGKEATQQREQAKHEERLKGISYSSLDEAINSTAKLRDQRLQAERLIIAANEIEAGGGSFAENVRIGDALKLDPTGPSSAERKAAAKRLAPSEHDIGLLGRLQELDQRAQQAAYFKEQQVRGGLVGPLTEEAAQRARYVEPSKDAAQRRNLNEQIAAATARREQPTFEVGPEEIARARQVAEDRLQAIGKAAVRQQFKSPSGGKDSEYGRFTPSAFTGQTFEQMQATYAQLAKTPTESLPVPEELEAARTAEQAKQLVAGHAAVVEDATARLEEVAGKTPAQVAESGKTGKKASQGGAFNNECCERIVAGLNLVRDAVVALGEKGLTLRGLSTAAKKGQIAVGPEFYEQGSANANRLRLEELKGKKDEVSSQERSRLLSQLNAAEILANEKTPRRQTTRTPQTDEQRLANTQQRLRQKGADTTAVSAAIRDLLPPDIRAQVAAAQGLKTGPRISQLAKAAVDLQELGYGKQVAEGKVARSAGIGGASRDPDRVRLHAAIDDEIISTQRVAEAKRKAARDAQAEAEAMQVNTDRDRALSGLTQHLSSATLSWIAELNRLREEAAATLDRGHAVPLELQSQTRNAQVEVTRGLTADLPRLTTASGQALISAPERARKINTIVGATSQAERTSIGREANDREIESRLTSGLLQDAPQIQSKFWSAIFGTTGLGGRTISAASHAAARFFGYGLVFGITNELHKVFTASLETEAEFVRISDALNATGRSAGNLRSSLQGISSSLATPLEEVYTTASQLTGVFQNTQDVVFATKAVEQLKLISRGALNAQEAISSLQAISSAYGTTGGGAFQQIVDQATSIQNFTGANVEQLVEGAGGIAPQAAQFHLTQQQALLYPGLIAQRTNQSGTAAAEQLSRIFESLTAPKASQFLEARGLATPKQIRTSDFGAIITSLVSRRAKGTLPDGDVVALERLVGSRQARPLAALIGTQGQALQTLRGASAADDSAGAGAQRVNQLMQQLNRQFQQISVNITNIGASIARSGLLDGLSLGIGYSNTLLRSLGKVADLVKLIGHIPIFGALTGVAGKFAVIAGTLYVLSKAVGTAYGSVQRFVHEKTPTRLSAGPTAFGPEVNTAAGLGVSEADLGVTEQEAMTLRARQAAIRSQSLTELQEQGFKRPSFLSQPAVRLLGGVGNVGARVLTSNFFARPASSLTRGLDTLETKSFPRLNSLTTSAAGRLSRMGDALTVASASSAVLEKRILGVAESSRTAGLLMTGLNAGLLALPFILLGLQQSQQSRSQFKELGQSLFPNAYDPTSAVGSTSDQNQDYASTQAINAAKGQNRSLTGRATNLGATVVHSFGATIGNLGGLFHIPGASSLASSQSDAAQRSMDAFGGSFNDQVNTIGAPVRGAIPLNDVASKNAEVTLAQIKGIENKSKSIQEIDDSFNAQFRAISEDPKLSDVQKTVASEDLARWQRIVTNIQVQTQETADGIKKINQLNADQAGAFSDIVQSGLGLTRSQIHGKIGRQFFQTYQDQNLVAPNSRSAYLMAALFGGSEAAPNPHSKLNPDTELHPGAGVVDYSNGPSDSQLRERRILDGANPNTGPGRLRIANKLANQLEQVGIPSLFKALKLEKDNKDKYDADLQKYQQLLQFDGQLRDQIAQEAAGAARSLAQILEGRGDTKGALKALQDAVDQDRKNVQKTIPGTQERNDAIIQRQQDQRAKADLRASGAIDAATLAGAQSLDPQVQAQSQLQVAKLRQSELLKLRAAGKGGVTNDDLKQAAIAVAQAQAGIVAQADSVIQAYDSIAVAAARNPTDSIAAQIHAAEDALTHAHGAAAKDAALAQLAGLRNQAADNVEQIAESAAALVQARDRDPFQKSRDAISELRREIAYAKSTGDTAKVNQLTAQLVQAQQDAASLAAQEAQANYSLLIAIATAGGDVVKAARLGLRQATAAYNAALKANGGNKNAPDVKNAKAAVVAAKANIRDTYIQQREDDLSFEYEMGKISLQTYEAGLKQLLKLKDLTKAQRHQIELTLHQLALDNQGQWNFGDIKLPTPYEVRRLVSTGGRPGRYQGSFNGGIGSSDVSAHSAASTHIVHNNTTHIKINGADVGMVKKVLTDLLGPQAISRQTTRTRKVG